MTTDAEGAALRERVARRLQRHHGRTVTGFEPLLGGHSGLTYRVSTDSGPLVVKAVPAGRKPIGRHDMLRQAAILSALARSDVPVPHVITVDREDPAWFAMDLVEGEALEPVLDDPPVPSSLAAARMRSAAEALPRLHAVDFRELPDAGDILTPSDELARWARTLDAVPPELVPRGQELLDLLTRSVPPPIPPTLIHGDYRLGNIICTGSDAAALIDWEIWSVGDPRVELGWFTVFADGANFPGVGRQVAGLPSPAQLVDTYAIHATHGRSPDLPDMAWFHALGRLKMAAIMGHNLRRHREGRHHDPAQEQLPATITKLLDSGTELLAGSPP